MREDVLKTMRLSKKYHGKYVVNNLNIKVKSGDIYGLIGKNGAGKTTLIRMIMGLADVSSGDIELFGKQSSKELINARKRVGTLIEMPAFYGDMTAFDNMEMVRLQKGIPGQESIKEKLELVGLNNIGKKKVKDFSLGMKQKLGLAMALIGDPEFLILDEPTNGLDPMGIVRMRELLKRINREKGTTILISSHLLSELYQLANCYGIINNGELLEELTQIELDEKCKKALEIRIDNVGKATWVLENVVGTTNYKVLDNNSIKIYDYINEPGIISKSLGENGIIIYQINATGDDLEDYFINLIGGK